MSKEIIMYAFQFDNMVKSIDYIWMLNQSCILGFKKERGTSLAVQWLRLQASTAGGIDSIPSWGTKILFAVPLKKKRDCTVWRWQSKDAISFSQKSPKQKWKQETEM